MQWFVDKIDGLSAHLDSRFDGLDERLRSVETNEAGCHADMDARISSLAEIDKRQDTSIANLEGSRNTWNILNSVGVAIVAIYTALRGVH
jgi:hypothetical protein